jgi:glucokinase
MNWAIGVDLGGTVIKAAFVSRDGSMRHAFKTPTHAHKGRNHVLEERFVPMMRGLIRRGEEEGMEIVGIGVAVASPLDPWKGVVHHPPNLPGWGIFPLLSYLEERFTMPVYMDNDANLFALGEWKWGSGEGATPLLCLTLGTGVGGGIVYENGRIWHGAHGCGGELGHITVDMNGPVCNCGNRGCLEAMASATALQKWIDQELGKGAYSTLSSGSDAKEIALAARLGDDLAMKAFQWLGRNLGVGLASLANAFDPRVIVLGGGLSKTGMLLLSPAVSEFKRRALPLVREKVEIRLATLENMGGVLGAALLAFQREENRARRDAK